MGTSSYMTVDALKVAVLLGLWTALNHPVLFIVLLIIFVIVMIWILPKLWTAIKKVFAFIGRFFGEKSQAEQESNFAENMENFSQQNFSQQNKGKTEEFETKLQLNMGRNKKE